MSTPRGLVGLFALLMLLSTAAFVIGVTVEKNQGDSHSAVEPGHSDEGTAAHEEAEGAHSEVGGGASSEGSESLLGVDLESTPIVILGALMSLALIGAVVRWPRREVLAVAVLFCLGFAALDGRELAHKLDENSGAVAAIAALTLLLHLAAAATAALALARENQEPGVSVAT
jgi:hypothetical protein